MCDVHFRMFADKVHLLIQCLYALHVCSCIVSQLDLVAATDALCAPVEVSHVYRATYFMGDSVEACLPSLARLTCAFRCKCKVYYLACLHFLDYAEDDVAASLSVHRNASELAQKPSEWSPEKFSLYHAVRLTADRYIIKV